MIQTILLAIDGSRPAERAAEFAAWLAMCHGAKMTVLQAFTPVPPSHLGEPNYDRARTETRKMVESEAAKIAEQVREVGVTEVETKVVLGSAVQVILDAVESDKPDLLVMGARGLGTWKGIILGSVSMAVTQRAGCPVLVVK